MLVVGSKHIGIDIKGGCPFCNEEKENINHIYKLMTWHPAYGLLLIFIILTLK